MVDDWPIFKLKSSTEDFTLKQGSHFHSLLNQSLDMLNEKETEGV